MLYIYVYIYKVPYGNLSKRGSLKGIIVSKDSGGFQGEGQGLNGPGFLLVGGGAPPPLKFDLAPHPQ